MKAGCEVTNCCRQLFAPAGVFNTAGSCFLGPLPDYYNVERAWVRNLPLLSFRSLGIFVLSTTPAQITTWLETSVETLVIVFTRIAACMARILPMQRSRCGVGLNRSAMG